MTISSVSLHISALQSFDDNYIWLIADPTTKTCLAIDPGDAVPVLAWLADRPGWLLTDVLITHHHHDHVDGLVALKAATNCRVHGPDSEAIPVRDQALSHGSCLHVLGRQISVLGVPGHTMGHLAYQVAQEGLLFTGDTLFSAGCGRLFEGTPAQMLASLDLLAALPGETKVFCAHEYTVSNLRFALAVEPENPQIAKQLAKAYELRGQGLCTLPTTIAIERAINPFLRVRQGSVIKAAQRHLGAPIRTPLDCFTILRAWKDHFQPE